MQGTSLHFFHRTIPGIPVTPVVFESGQHEDRLSVNRAIAASINCMRTIGMVNAQDVENVHDIILQKFSNHLPKIVTLVHRHEIKMEDNFVMQEGYKNFSKVEKGEVLALDVRGPIISPISGRLLMPLYQKKGEDGFFIVKDIDKL